MCLSISMYISLSLNIYIYIYIYIYIRDPKYVIQICSPSIGLQGKPGSPYM